MAPSNVLRGSTWGSVGLVLLVLLASWGAGLAQDEGVPLGAPGGPYRGTVLDERTGGPVPEAVVVILWQRLDDQIQGLRRLAAAAETFTDARGEFALDVLAVEQRLASRSLAPRIVIFRPGYAPVPRTPQLRPPGVPASGFGGAGAVVRLARVADYEERSEALNTFVAMLSAAQLFPGPEVPQTSALIRFELESLGVKPPTPMRPPGGR